MWEPDISDELKEKIDDAPNVFGTGLMIAPVTMTMYLEDKETGEGSEEDESGLRLVFIESPTGMADHEDARMVSVAMLPVTAINLMIQLGSALATLQDIMRYNKQFAELDGRENGGAT